MILNTIEKMSPDMLVEFSNKLCTRMKELRSRENLQLDEILEKERIYGELLEIQVTLRSYRIRVGKVDRKLRVISS